MEEFNNKNRISVLGRLIDVDKIIALSLIKTKEGATVKVYLVNGDISFKFCKWTYIHPMNSAQRIKNFIELHWKTPPNIPFITDLDMHKEKFQI